MYSSPRDWRCSDHCSHFHLLQPARYVGIPVIYNIRRWIQSKRVKTITRAKSLGEIKYVRCMLYWLESAGPDMVALADMMSPCGMSWSFCRIIVDRFDDGSRFCRISQVLLYWKVCLLVNYGNIIGWQLSACLKNMSRLTGRVFVWHGRAPPQNISVWPGSCLEVERISLAFAAPGSFCAHNLWYKSRYVKYGRADKYIAGDTVKDGSRRPVCLDQRTFDRTGLPKDYRVAWW